MRPLMILFFAAAILVFVRALIGPAFAAGDEIALTSILQPIRAYLVEIAAALVLAFTGWLTSWLRVRFRIEMDAHQRQTLHSALDNGARLILEQIENAVGEKTITVGSPWLKIGIDYVTEYSPQAAAYFGLTPDQLGEMLRAKLVPAT